MWALFPSLMSYTCNACSFPSCPQSSMISSNSFLMPTPPFEHRPFQNDIFSGWHIYAHCLQQKTPQRFMSTLNLIVLCGRSMQDERCVWEIWERERFELLTCQAVSTQFTQLSDVVTHLLSVEDRGQEVAWRGMNQHVRGEVFHAALFLLRRAWMCSLSCSSNNMHIWNRVPRTDLKS